MAPKPDKVPTPEEMTDRILSSYELALTEVGFTEGNLARMQWELAHVEVVKHLKVKGRHDKRRKIGENYRFVIGNGDETLIEGRFPNHEIRLKAVQDVQKLLGKYPKEQLELTGNFSELFLKVLEKVQSMNQGLPPLPSQQEDEE